MESIPSPQSFIFSDDYICLWESCHRSFEDAEMLYEHLRDEHVGRKAHHNLCLTCKWDKCTVPTFAKRDHITSHLRVHVASKPYSCEICKKGFKRPQDLKKHEKTHQEASGGDSPVSTASTIGGTINNTMASALPGHFHTDHHHQPYQPMTPPSYLDRSPSIPASTVSAIHSPYNMPLSPASMVDPNDSWNPSLASPSFSANTDLFSSPGASELDFDIVTGQTPTRPSNIDISAAVYGAYSSTTTSANDLQTPQSGKRNRDFFDEILTDTLGAFTMESKKKRLDSSYNEDMAGRLNALYAILEVNPLTPDRLLSSLPDVNDWNQFNQLNQFCSTLFEDVSGEIFESQSIQNASLFSDFDNKLNPVAFDVGVGNVGSSTIPSLNAAPAHEESIYSKIIPVDHFAESTTVSPQYNSLSSTMPWDTFSAAPGISPAPTQGVMTAMPSKNVLHQASINPFHNQRRMDYVMNSPASVKIEPKEDFIKSELEIKVERNLRDMSTQTRERQEMYASGGMMMASKPTQKKKQSKVYEDIDPEILLLQAPSVPNTPFANVDDAEEDDVDQDDASSSAQATEVAAASEQAVHQQAPASKFGNIVERARAKQAAAAAAAAAAASTEPLDPIEAMTRQLADTRLDAGKSATARPVAVGDRERQIRASNARALCSQDPVRRQHAEVVFNLLKSIDSLMVDHRRKVDEWRTSQDLTDSGEVTPRAGSPARTPKTVHSGVSAYPKTGAHVQNQGQIRTVSSYLPRRAPHQPSPLYQEHSKEASNYIQLRSDIADTVARGNGQGQHGSSTLESQALYPSQELHAPAPAPVEEEQFELSEEERRFIEEDNAAIAAAKTAASGYQSIHV